MPFVDDNVKLTVQQYRRILYQDIERRYPEENSAYKNVRSANSFTKPRKQSADAPRPAHSPQKPQLKRQKSLIQVRPQGKKVESSPLKGKAEGGRAGRGEEGRAALKKSGSKACLVKKGGTPAPKFKK